jgi:hypothetical protein
VNLLAICNSGTAGSTSFFSKKSCSETNGFSRFACRVSDVVHPKTAADRKALPARGTFPYTLNLQMDRATYRRLPTCISGYKTRILKR